MQENLLTRRSSLLSKIVAVAFLPLLAFIWMIGWTLTIIGEKFEFRDSIQKTLKIHPRFESQEEELEPLDEDAKTNYEQPITA